MVKRLSLSRVALIVVLAVTLLSTSACSGFSVFKPGDPGTTTAKPSDPQSQTYQNPEPEPQKPPAPPEPPKPVKKPAAVRGLYLTGYSAGSDEKLREIVGFVKAAGLNALVIDAKDDDGLITWETDIPLAKEISSNSRKIKDIGSVLKILHDNEIYSIARVVAFVDPVLAKGRPSWAILNGQWKDRRGLAWGNPYNENVWKYNVEVARAAARAGFKEIQFDYVRFPERDIEGITHNVSMEKRVNTINDFLKYAKQELSEYPVYISADVFGLTTTVADDMKIGQDYAALAQILDYISPMIYPSHYSPGNYGLRDPESSPRETVYGSMFKGRERTPDLKPEVHRPWIQDFSLRVKYGKTEIEAQLRGLAEAGITTFMVWDPSNRYTRNVDYSIIDQIKPLPKPEPPKPGAGATTGGQVYGQTQ